MDLMCEGKKVAPEVANAIVTNKTGALIRASLLCGAILAGGSPEEIRILGKFGELLGAFFRSGTICWISKETLRKWAKRPKGPKTRQGYFAPAIGGRPEAAEIRSQ